jgi:hypothetical protein
MDVVERGTHFLGKEKNSTPIVQMEASTELQKTIDMPDTTLTGNYTV